MAVTQYLNNKKREKIRNKLSLEQKKYVAWRKIYAWWMDIYLRVKMKNWIKEKNTMNRWMNKYAPHIFHNFDRAVMMESGGDNNAEVQGGIIETPSPTVDMTGDITEQIREERTDSVMAQDFVTGTADKKLGGTWTHGHRMLLPTIMTHATYGGSHQATILKK
jgi:hypothetical protein